MAAGGPALTPEDLLVQTGNLFTCVRLPKRALVILG